MCAHVNSVRDVIVTLVPIRTTANAELSNALAVVGNNGKIVSALCVDVSVEFFCYEKRVIFCEHILFTL